MLSFISHACAAQAVLAKHISARVLAHTCEAQTCLSTRFSVSMHARLAPQALFKPACVCVCSRTCTCAAAQVALAKHFSNKKTNVELAADLLFEPFGGITDSNRDDVDAMRTAAIGRGYSAIYHKDFSSSSFFKDMAREMTEAGEHGKLLRILTFVDTNFDCWGLPFDSGCRNLLDPR